MNLRDKARICFIYLIAIGAGFALSEVRAPLAWMTGSLLSTVAFGLFLDRTTVPRVTRPVGQIVVAASVGLYFTPVVVQNLVEHAVAMLIAAILTLLASFLVAGVLARVANMDIVAASLASLPGGPVEMANLSEKYGVPPGPVAFAQIFRILVLVLAIPPIVVFLDGHAYPPGAGSTATDYVGAMFLLIVGIVGGGIFKLAKVPNPFFLGPMALSAAAAGLSLPVAAVPSWLMAGAQVLLGVWLGAMFNRELLRETRAMLRAIVGSTATLIALCVCVGLTFSVVLHTRWQTMILAVAPGAVTEMALTAKLLGEGVAMVTAYHLVRLFLIMPSTPLLIAFIARKRSKKQID